MSNSIAVVIESMGGGGAQQVVVALLRHWCQDGREVHLITFQSPSVDAFEVPAQVPRYVVGGSGASRGLFSGLVKNFRRLVALRAAIAHAGSPVILAFVTETNVLTILASLGLGRRVVVSERNDPHRQSLSPVWRLMRRLVYPLADMVTANSHMAVQALSAMGVSSHVAWLPNPLRQATSKHTAERKGRLLLAVGRLHPQKGYDTLLEAFALARPRMREWTLRILGAGRLEAELRSLCSRLGLGDCVEFLGHVTDPFPHYRAADVFVMASRYEGSPNALWEAMSCGLPVIVNDSIEGALEVVTDGENARVVPAGNADALAAALEALAGDPALRDRLGRQAAVAVRQFAPDEVFGVWDELLFEPRSA